MPGTVSARLKTCTCIGYIGGLSKEAPMNFRIYWCAALKILHLPFFWCKELFMGWHTDNFSWCQDHAYCMSAGTLRSPCWSCLMPDPVAIWWETAYYASTSKWSKMLPPVGSAGLRRKRVSFFWRNLTLYPSLWIFIVVRRERRWLCSIRNPLASLDVAVCYCILQGGVLMSHTSGFLLINCIIFPPDTTFRTMVQSTDLSPIFPTSAMPMAGQRRWIVVSEIV